MARVRLALMLATTFVLVAALAIVVFGPTGSASSPRGYQGALSPPSIPPQDFVLTDQDGARVALSDFRGQTVAVTFLYSTCEDTCPTAATTIRAALDELGDDGVPVLAVSVDPANDTPERARRFLNDRRLTGRMRFLLGSRDELAPVWDGYGIQPQGEDFEHSARIVLIDGTGRQRISWPIGEVTEAGLANDLRLLAAEAAPPG